VRAALRYLPRRRASWEVKALAISGQTGEGLDALWDVIEDHRRTLEATGELAAMRAEQQRSWMWSLITDRLERTFRMSPDVAARLAAVESQVLAGKLTPPNAADELFAAFGKGG
jgi:LAO/AO transport system kinase